MRRRSNRRAAGRRPEARRALKPGIMPATNVSFYSGRHRIAALLYASEPRGGAPRPAIVMVQGMVGRKELFGFPRSSRGSTPGASRSGERVSAGRRCPMPRRRCWPRDTRFSAKPTGTGECPPTRMVREEEAS